MRLVSAIVSLLLVLPSVAAANTMVQNPEKNHNETEIHDCPMGRHSKERIPFEVKQAELQSWAETYTPDKAAEWRTVLAERNQLHEKWMSAEMAPRRESWKQEKQARIEEIKSLRRQLEEGKMTREEFLKRVHEKMHGKGASKLKGHFIYPRLKAAVEKGDKKQAAQLLDDMLLFFKSHNERMAERMK
ncbi:hypothetical protein A8F94_21940 [Bacillus sp. FJAT-27225]|uniref:hypothetical protein n=1 Tax=Bacillus sp. FJAT-27225 TaxID=1743144 RepID=UPI00080C334F|nr:hypothetical protein [Bacillus sp. FJAT-27225]OCA81538.1 hypothetical protein A8F94_21940 [Bacillus sp. FJAT-27225]